MKAKDLSIKVYAGNETRPLERELFIDQNNLSGELAEQPSWYAYYGTLQVDAASDYDQAKGEYEKLQAEISSEIRSSYKKQGIKVTESQIETETIMDSRVQGMRRRVLDLKRNAEIMKVATRAFEQRLQSLMSICALERVQLQNAELSLKSNSHHNNYSKQNHPDIAMPSRAEFIRELEDIQTRYKKEDSEDK